MIDGYKEFNLFLRDLFQDNLKLSDITTDAFKLSDMKITRHLIDLWIREEEKNATKQLQV